MWDATSGGNQIQSITLQGSGGIPTNQIASVTEKSTVNFTYDAAGNVTNDGIHSYGYDSENRIVSVDGGSTASYAYDHQNRRYKKTIGSTVTHYVWQGWQVLAEYNGSTGAVLTDYVYTGSRMIAKVASGSTQYFLSDRLSTRLVLDSGGSVSGRMAHLAFGEDFGESGTQEKHHFTSYERDSESGTDYAVNRQYSQSIGRFNRPDPYVVSGTQNSPQNNNRYVYSKNEPIGSIDPSGLDSFAPYPGFGSGMPWEWSWFFGWSGWFPANNVATSQPNSGTHIPINFDFIGGDVIVEGNCDDALYVPEDNIAGSDHPELAWFNPPRDIKVRADFVATPRGIVKIPGGCHCRVSCAHHNDYKITCGTLLFIPDVLTDDEMHAQHIVADPRELWIWVAKRDRHKPAVIDPLSRLYIIN
jgi:RHS repeat-associated protein